MCVCFFFLFLSPKLKLVSIRQRWMRLFQGAAAAATDWKTSDSFWWNFFSPPQHVDAIAQSAFFPSSFTMRDRRRKTLRHVSAAFFTTTMSSVWNVLVQVSWKPPSFQSSQKTFYISAMFGLDKTVVFPSAHHTPETNLTAQGPNMPSPPMRSPPTAFFFLFAASII